MDPQLRQQVDRVAAEPDPARRAVLAGELIAHCNARIVEESRTRRQAVDELVDVHGWQQVDVADLLHITRARVGSIRGARPKQEDQCATS